MSPFRPSVRMFHKRARRLATRIRMIVFAVATLSATGCAGHDVVTLPNDIRISHPSSDLPPSLAALSGRWDGRWDGTSILVLIVERIDRYSASVIYAYGGSSTYPPVTTRARAQVIGDRAFVIEFPSVVIRFELSGSFLEGESRRRSDGTRIARISMMRFSWQPGLVALRIIGPPGADVSLNNQLAGAPIGPEGTYGVTLSPGQYVVGVSRLGFEPWQERLQLTRNEPRVTRTVALTPLQPPSVRVLEPEPGAVVTATSVQLRAEITSAYRLHRVSISDATDNPSLLSPQPGMSSGEPWRIDTELRLNPGTNRITLEAEDEHGGKATHVVVIERRVLPTVELRGPPGVVIELGGQRHLTDVEGRAIIALAPGTYEILATKEGFQPLRIPLTLSDGESQSIQNLAMIPLAATPGGPVKLSDTPPADSEPPRIVLNYPLPNARLESSQVTIIGLVSDNVGLNRVEVTVNGTLIPDARDIQVVGRSVALRRSVGLQPGENIIEVMATDLAGNSAQLVATVTRLRPAATTRGDRRRWAVVIGVGEYDDPAIPALRFADRDAQAMYRFLITRGGYPPENVLLLTDTAALKPTLQNIRRALGDFLSRKPDREDMVLVYYAGHGAPEIDASGTEVDGFSRYLVPRDAEAQSLYSTAFPMDEIERVFRRIPAEQVIVLLDTCYSGSAGGRTFSRSQTRSPLLSDRFLEKLARSRGRLIITASGANEVALELPELAHGLFTHYVLEGLAGQADRDRDGVITVAELYEYVEREVDKKARSVGGRQRPLMKGEIEGSLPIAEVQ